MGYACPVCGVEEADAVHLANHLAITASLGREDHLAWLDEHAPDWADRGPEDLGATVAERAPEVETPEFEDAGHERAHDSGRPHLEDEIARGSAAPGRGARTAETQAVLEEARDLTRRMQGDTGTDGDSSASEGGTDASEASAGDADGGEAGGSDAGRADADANEE